ncbi:S8 family serine peptidase [Pontibacter ummariensis]|nr:S8 family serine peptidase [Pontibacter ummariensis]
MLQRTLWGLLLSLIFMPLLYAQRPAHYGSGTVPNTVVYKLKPVYSQVAGSSQRSGSALQTALQQVGAQHLKQKFPKESVPAGHARTAAPAVDLSLIYELKYDDGKTLEEVRKALLATGMVAYVEPLYLREPLHQPNDPAADSTKATQYYLKLIQAYGGWDEEKGDTTMVIGVLDTGFRLTHQELKDKIKYNYADPVDGVDNDQDGLVDNFSGWDFADADNNVQDDTQWKGHGTSVASVAAGSTNNGTGLASLGYKALFMPLKVFSSDPNGPFSGYEAIVYAANKGCKVINLSWGGTGMSAYEQDIINYAVLDKDVVIVASAGNTNALLDIYPASYDNVLSVGGTDDKDVKYKDYTYSYKIDLTAPSTNVYAASIAGDNAYTGGWGTSIASPLVAGTAALVRKKYPALNARQVAERLRVTTDNIYTLPGNQAYLEKLGKGRLNVKKALKQQAPKSVRCTSFSVADKQLPFNGSTIRINASFLNYLSPTSNLKVTLTSPSPYVSVEQGTLTLGSLGIMGEADSGQQPFVLKIARDAPINAEVYLRVGFEDENYQDFQYFPLILNPEFVTLSANRLQVTINGKGNFGYNGLNLSQGVGVQYNNSPSLLFEGGLMVATNRGLVSDNLHNENWVSEGDFVQTSPTRLSYNTPLAHQEVRTAYAATGAEQAGVQVRHAAYAWATDPNQHFVVVEYQITNLTSETIDTLHAGLFADWDIGSYMENWAGWDQQRQLGYVYNKNSNLPYVGIKLLTADKPLYHAIDNIGEDASTVTVDDGFSDVEKYKILSGGLSRKEAGGLTGNNVSHVVGASYLQLAPGETKTVAFALLAGDNLKHLQQHADAAQVKYIDIKSGPVPLAARTAICPGNSVTITPQGGSTFNFYADKSREHLLGSGEVFSLGSVNEDRTIYVSNADSLFESAVSPFTYLITAEPVASIGAENAFGNIGKNLRFVNNSTNASSWKWDFGDGTTSDEEEPEHVYHTAGVYRVTLTVTDSLGCFTSVTSKTLTIYSNSLTLFPNPAREQVMFTLTAPVDLAIPSSLPHLTLTDMAGKTVRVPQGQVSGANMYFKLDGLASGLYLVHIRYHNSSYVERLVVKQ